MFCRRRETWPLNPPEVRDAVLQFAGWGPLDQQLVRSLHCEITLTQCWHAAPMCLNQSGIGGKAQW